METAQRLMLAGALLEIFGVLLLASSQAQRDTERDRPAGSFQQPEAVNGHGSRPTRPG